MRERNQDLTTNVSDLTIKHIAAEFFKDKRLGISDRDKIVELIENYLKNLTFHSMGEIKLSPEKKSQMSMMSKERVALKCETNRELIIIEVENQVKVFSQAVENEAVENEIKLLKDESDNLDIEELTTIPFKLSDTLKKKFVQQTVEVIDQYSRKLEILFDFDKKFNKILYNLANITSHKAQLNRLILLAKYDPEIEVITQKLLSLGEDDPVYKGFFREFTKFRMNYLQVVAIRGKVNVYNSIHTDCDKILLDRWKRRFNTKSKDLSRERREQLSERIGLLMNYMGVVGERPAESNKNAITKYEEEKKQAKKYLTKEVPEHLKIMSMGKNGPAEIMIHTFNHLGVELPVQFASMSMNGESFGDIKMINGEDLSHIRRFLTNWELDIEEIFTREGQLGLFTRIAKKAIGFSDYHFIKSFKDSKKKTRYAFVSPNKILLTAHKIIEKGLSDNKYCNNYIAQLASSKGNEGMLKDMKIAMILDVRTDHLIKGVNHKSLDNSEFIFTRHALFNSYKTVKKPTVSAIYQPIVINGRRLNYGVTFPTNYKFIENGEVTERAVDCFFNSVFKGEFERIKKIQAVPELGLQYNTFIQDDKILTSPFIFLTELNKNQRLLEEIAIAKNVKDITTYAREALKRLLTENVNSYEAKLKKFPKVLEMNRKIYHKGFQEGHTIEDGDRKYAGVFALNDRLIRIAFSELLLENSSIRFV